MKEGAEGGLPLGGMVGGVGVVADVFEGDELLGGGGGVEDAAGIFRKALRRRVLAVELAHPLVVGKAKRHLRCLQALGERRFPCPDEAME